MKEGAKCNSLGSEYLCKFLARNEIVYRRRQALQCALRGGLPGWSPLEGCSTARLFSLETLCSCCDPCWAL